MLPLALMLAIVSLPQAAAAVTSCDDGRGQPDETLCEDGTRCDVDTLTCRQPCTGDDQCPSGELCHDDGVCFPGCRGDSDCGPDEACLESFGSTFCGRPCDEGGECGDGEVCLEGLSCVADSSPSPAGAGGCSITAGMPESLTAPGPLVALLVALGVAGLVRRRRRCLILLLGAAATAAPTAGCPNGDPQPIGLTFYASPHDLTSNLGQRPTFELKGGIARTFSAEQLQPLADQVELLEYPSLRSVPIDVSITRTGLSAAPRGDLADAWHLFSLRQIPYGYAINTRSWLEAPSGELAVRIHPGPMAVLSSLVLCDKPTTRRAVVELSETLSGDNLAPSLGLSLGSSPCALVEDPPGAFSSFLFDCPQGDAGDLLRITVSAPPADGSPTLQLFDAALPFDEQRAVGDLDPDTVGPCPLWQF
jgi:hypothetical protein